MKGEKIFNTKRFKKQHHVSKVCTLDLWNSRYQHLILIGRLRVETKTLPADMYIIMCA